jgi:Tol biopolymer transport system component
VIALACNEGDARLIVAAADGSGARVVRIGRRGFPQIGGLEWSPDGATVVFYETRLSPQRHLVGALAAVGRDGRGFRVLRRVHGFISLETTPSWDRDGRTLAYQPDGRHVGLLRMPQGRLLRTINGTRPAFSPDGRRLAFERGGELIVRTNAFRAVGVVASSVYSWAPDSRSLAFVGDGPRVGVVRADGSGRRFVTPRYDDLLDLAWRR